MVWYLPQNSNLTWHDLANCRLKRGRWGYIKTYTFIEKWIHFISDAGSGWRLFPKDAQTYPFFVIPKCPFCLLFSCLRQAHYWRLFTIWWKKFLSLCSTISACLLAEYMNAGQKEELSPAVQRFWERWRFKNSLHNLLKWYAWIHSYTKNYRRIS